jgi:cysteine-rich repeat protein
VIDGAETCDDGNVTPGDGCSAVCTIDSGYECPTPGTLCNKICSNGVINSPEACDDGNETPSDGCSTTCTLDSGYECLTPGSACNLICGNSKLNSGNTETCDLGPNNGGVLGCSSTCAIQNLWSCVGAENALSTCTFTCGDGSLTTGNGEVCDDGGTSASPEDGCSALCALTSGWECPTPGSAC